MKESMMRGFKGAEVRCRKCGGTIAVLTPGTSPRTPSAREHDPPPIGRQGPSPGHGGPAEGEGASQTRTALAEEPDAAESLPDNVYPLHSYRAGRPKRLPIEGYDISDAIRPDPPPPPTGRSSADGSPTLAQSLERSRTIRTNLMAEPIRWQQEGIASAPTEGSPAPRDRSPASGKSSADKSLLPGGMSTSVPPRPTHIAMVYLLLLILGGVGYLLVRYFSYVFNGGGG